MHDFVRPIAAALAAAMLTTPVAARDVTIIVDDAYKPYTFVDDNGQITGIYTKVLREIDQNMSDYNIKLNAYPWKRGVNMMKTGSGFALAPPYRWPERRPFIHPYSEKILEEEVVSFCRKDVMDQKRPDWPDDYTGLTVGNNRGFETPGKAFFDLVDQGKIELEEANSTLINLRKLVAKRIDCYVNARASIRWNLEILKKKGAYDPKKTELIESVVIRGNWGYVGFSRKNQPEYKADFIQALNQEIVKMRENGRLQEIFDNFLRAAGS